MFKHILVGFDGSASSQRGFNTALEIAASLGGDLTVMQVLSGYDHVFGDSRPARDLPTRSVYESAVMAAAQRAVAGLADAARTRGVPCRSVLEFAVEPHKALLQQALRCDCDLIVMGNGDGREGGGMSPGGETESALVCGGIPVLVVGALPPAPRPPPSG